MKTTKILFGAAVATALLGFSLSATAQENGNRDENGKVVRGAYETNNRFFDNTFIEFGAGLNAVYNEKEFGNTGIATQLNFGKWFTPTVGARIGWHGLKNEIEGYEDAIDAFHFFHGDFLWNISNALSGYKETRFWDIVPFVGFGGLLTQDVDDDNNWEFALGAGLINNFRLGNRVDLNLEFGALVSREAAYTDKSRFIGFPYATVGLAINLGKTAFARHTSATPVVVPVPFTTEQYKALQDKVNALEQENASLKNRISELENREPEKVYVEADAPATATLYFDLGKSKLSQRELAHLEYFASNLDKDAKLSVTGSADSATGSKGFNEKLAAQRAEYVKGLLVNTYGLSADNISTDSGLDAFNTPAKSRVVIIK